MTVLSRFRPDLRLVGLAFTVTYILLGAYSATGPEGGAPIRGAAGLLLALFLATVYGAGYRAVRLSKAGSRVRTIGGFTALFAILGGLTYPFHSTDVFAYVTNGWLQTEYGLNPYVSVPRDVEAWHEDSMLANPGMRNNRNPWPDLPIPYGFLFAHVTRVISWLGGGHFMVTVALFKLLSAGVFAASAWLLWKCAARLGLERPDLILYLFGWSPLIILHHVANGHNDLLMALLALVGLYTLLIGREGWSIPAVVAAGLVKYAALPLVPFALIFVKRTHGWRTTLAGSFAAGLLFGLVSYPYLREFDRFKLHLIVAQMTESTGSPQTFLFYVYRLIASVTGWLPDASAFQSAVRVVFVSGLVILAAAQLWRMWKRNSSLAGLVQDAVLLQLILVCAVSSQFYAWYLGMFFPVALLSQNRWLKSAAVALSVGHLLSFTFVANKAIGYFLLATALPLAVVWARHRRRNGEVPAESGSHYLVP